MKTPIFPLIIAAVLLCLAPLAKAQDDQLRVLRSILVAKAQDDRPRVLLETNQGAILLELNAKAAPITVENFLRYVNEGFYDGTVFHRVISNFMIQGGGYTEDLEKKETHGPIKNEADNGLKNNRGTIAMGRTPEPHSASAQFYINVVDNNSLNHHSPTHAGWGYAVFGQVIDGMDTVDKIRNTPTGSGGRFWSDVPKTTVIIQKASVVSNATPAN